MATHVKVLGILHIVLGALGVLAGLGLLALFGGIAGLVDATADFRDARVAIPILQIIAWALFGFLSVISLPGIIAGIGLLQFQNWARILTIVLSALDLLNVPIGTALGIYGLWVLLSPGTEQLFVRR
jgi:hypothetical protein